MSLFNIVTVVFKDELSILKVQAQSIAQHFSNIDLAEIKVVVNDSPDIIDHIDPNWWGKLAKQVRIEPRSLYWDQFESSGWVSQQVLKLLASTPKTSKWTIVLDAKTIFVKPFELGELFDRKSRIRSGHIPVYSVFKPSQDILSKFFNIPVSTVIGPSGVPFFFHNQTVTELVDMIETTQRQPFAKWFEQQGMVTEFMLYSAFVQHQNLNLYTDYFPYRIVNLCHSEVGLFDIKFKDMMADETLTVSIHRDAWRQLSLEQQEKYIKFLEAKGFVL